MELNPLSEQVFAAILSIGLPLMAALFFAILAHFGAVELAARIRATAKALRKYVDEPSDDIIGAIDDAGNLYFGTDIDEEKLSEILTAVLDALSAK